MRGRVSPYRGDRIIEANDLSVGEILKRCAETLGLPGANYFELHYIDESDSPSAQPGIDRLSLPRNDYEGTIFHEGAHYVMGKNGLFLMGMEGENFYARAVDETTAELATSEALGYHESQSGLLQKLLELPESTDDETGKLSSRTNISPDKIRGMLSRERDMHIAVRSHLDIEAKYAADQQSKPPNERMGSVSRDLAAFHAGIYHWMDFWDETGITSFIARYNAERMGLNGVKARDLVRNIDESLEKSSYSFRIFFECIVDKANKH